MNKIYIGIDISKENFDVCFSLNGKLCHFQFENSKSGFLRFLKQIPDEAWCVMEATGPYYLRLATFLFLKKITISVENPLKIKRFMQMNLQRTKTDKADALAIKNYGEIMQPASWKPEDSWVIELRQQQSVIDSFQKQITILKNQIEAFSQSTHPSLLAIRELNKNVRSIKLSMKKIEADIEKVLKEKASVLYEQLRSIPALGPKAAARLIVATNCFQKFESAKQLQCYIGLCPRVYQSGTSVKGRGAINKIGMSRMRKILYMCSLTAIKNNVACKEMYERLVQKGKAKKVALIAVANKLIRQAFAVAKKGVEYEEKTRLGLAF